MTKKKNTKDNLEELVEEQVQAENETQVVEDLVEELPLEKLPKEDDFEKKYAELNDTHLRLLAEFDNYRKRTMRERADLLKSAGESLLVNMLPLVDDFERGLKVMDEASDLAAVREGVNLIYGKFAAFLTQQGVKPIESFEKDFDTEFHEAITTIPAPTEALKGKVIDCVQQGYTLNDKVIRYAKVVVGE